MPQRCVAHQCPEKELPPGHWLCSWHWGLLKAEQRERLSEAWGWPAWKDVLREVLRDLRRVEAELPKPPW